MKIFTPTMYAKSIYDIDIDKLISNNIKVLILDIDNTLVPMGVKESPKEVKMWVENVKSYNISVCLVSNNTKRRVELFNKGIDLFYVYRAFKPMTLGFKRVAKKYGVKNSEVCVVGDQLFTDIWGANRAKMMSILINPISPEEDYLIKCKRVIEAIILNKIKPVTYGLIGNPVKHSLSPVLHKQVYEHYKINAEYVLYPIEKTQIQDFIVQCKENGVKGFNITVPFKQDIMPYLDVISDDAKKIGAVNTVKIINGKLYGYNTDGDGFVCQLQSDGTNIKNSKIKIVGAGGSTMALVFALFKMGASEITIYNRTIENAQKITKNFVNAHSFTLDKFTADNCDILINTTSVGLFPNNNDCPVNNLDGINSSATVYDLIYNPSETVFMKKARAKGCKVYNGYKMLIYQGLVADEIWFDKKMISQDLANKILLNFESGEK